MPIHFRRTPSILHILEPYIWCPLPPLHDLRLRNRSPQASGLTSAQFESTVKKIQRSFAASNSPFTTPMRRGYVGTKRMLRGNIADI